MIVYKLNPRFNDELLNSNDWHDIIEKKIIQIAEKENKIQILYELSEYIENYDGFAKKHL